MSVLPNSPTVAIDGATHPDSLTRKASGSPPQQNICCIFVHAGAGYHSIQNEQIHLDACADAAQMAMLILRNGGSAIDAVEMAVKVLEDREITNAGYGSNLAMDGVVECDASIVDHYGRSGAVGAVAQIKNPISLARLVLNHTMHTLTLRRVPPNLLVSQGATDFAIEQNVPILPHDALISPAARDRWIRWRADLKSAERKARKTGQPTSSWKIRKYSSESAQEDEARERIRQQHTRDLLKPYPSLMESPEKATPNVLDKLLEDHWNNDHVEDNSPSDPVSDESCWQTDERVPTPDSPVSEPMPSRPMVAPSHTVTESSRNAFINSTQKVPTVSQLKNHRALQDITGSHPEDIEMDNVHTSMKPTMGHNGTRKSWGDGSSESDSESSAKTMKAPAPFLSSSAAMQIPPPETPLEQPLHFPTPRGPTALSHVNENVPLPPAPGFPADEREDNITDTVGAIAVDSWGNIACGASSGGIGMKYRGRVGPAALVGIGTAVVPVNPGDDNGTCVATVTSGTGEHMATTMAATVCAERLYQGVRKGKGGEMEATNEDEALRSMIENEFMGHPSVENSNSAGAIGILGIKKTCEGVFLYFGHNTDSFAMASMHGYEHRPRCSMSRSSGNGVIAQGGRMFKYSSRKKLKPASR